MISKPSSVRGPRVLKQTKRTPLRLLQSLAKDGRIDMKLTQAQGTWRCTLAFRRGRAAHIMTPLTATGKSKNASLKQAWHQVCENGFRVKADTTPWLQEQLAALSSRSSDLRLCVVGSCHGESMHQAPLFAAKLKCANQYIMGKCGSCPEVPVTMRWGIIGTEALSPRLRPEAPRPKPQPDVEHVWVDDPKVSLRANASAILRGTQHNWNVLFACT
eukprot:g22740.t1